VTDVEPRWKDSLAAAAARAYEAAHGSAIPEQRRGLRVRMTWRQGAAGVLLVALLAGGAWWFSRPDAVPATPLPLASPGANGAPVVTLVVDVSGAVVAPGLVELAPGARVADALDAAGGASADAVLDGLNLARRVSDGEQILVPHAGDAEHTAGGLINLNQADADGLEQLPGVGPVLAARIVADREANGPFSSLKDLGRVGGVGDAIEGALEGVATV
jgi:competence protein ComEA